MPTFLSDPASGVYLILIAAAVVAGAVAAQRQNRRSLIALAVAVAILLLVFALDRSFESPREEAVRRVQAMAHAADTRNREAFAEHVAERFEYSGGGTPVTKTRSELMTSGFWDMLAQLKVHVAVWDFAQADVKEPNADTVEIGFMGKGEVEGKPFPVYLRATFARQANGQFRLTKFSTFHPTNHSEPLALPNFP